MDEDRSSSSCPLSALLLTQLRAPRNHGVEFWSLEPLSESERAQGWVLGLQWLQTCTSCMSAGGELYLISNRRTLLTHGRYMGIYIVFVTNGAHLAAVAGGFIALNIGWRWCYWIPAIIVGVNWLVNLFCLPETLYHRDNASGQKLQNTNTSWLKLYTFNGVHVTRKLRAWDFTHVFVMLKYPSVLLPAVYYSISFGIGSVLFAVTGAAAFGSVYHFNTAQIGLCIGLSTFIGTLLGEISAGPVSDRILYLYMKTHNGQTKPEARLQAMWPGFFLLPVGVIIEGVCLQYKTHWAGPVMGIGIAAVGLQIVSTNTFAYVTDVSWTPNF